ncbi:MAG: 1-deoxy-D-xylulose-5-phosphate synthase [Anaerovoracaceae bacterium]
MKHLKEMDLPNDLKYLSDEELKILCDEIRDILVATISRTGGHLASNLGVVELTVALDKIFDFSRDRIIWDVGHQSYVHKLLTGRADDFDTLRQLGGLSGFPKRNESEYDWFDTGHASNSISALFGMAAARDLMGEDYYTVAVIGDGSLTGGPALEGLNDLGASKTNALVILNDNGMSIGASKGGLAIHLAKLRTSPQYTELKNSVKKVGNIPGFGRKMYEKLEKVRDSLKYSIVNGIIFEEMGFTYFGPFDGHDLKSLTESLEIAKDVDGPVLVHVITKKGKGYRNAESEPDRFHGTGPFDPDTGVCSKNSSAPTYSEVFGARMLEILEEHKNAAAISAAMMNATGLGPAKKKFPDRVFDVGIAEGHGVSFAAGLALSGMHPFVAIYSTFLQRAYDQILMDVCMQDLPVTFCIDRAGVVGQDGETHHGIFDLSYLSSMPNMTVMAPRDGEELRQMMDMALAIDSPCAIRYPRAEDGDIDMPREPLDNGAEILKEGEDVFIWAVGDMVRHCLEAASMLEKQGIECGVGNVRFTRPLDLVTILDTAKRYSLIVTCEDNVLNRGVGEETVAEIKYAGIDCDVLCIAWPNKFIEHGTRGQLFEKYKMDASGIAERIREKLEEKT